MGWKSLFFSGRDKKSPKSLLERERIEDALAASPVPYILVVVLIWSVASVLLLCSEDRHRDLSVLRTGQYAPFAVWARNDFFYTDQQMTDALKHNARAQGKYIYRIDPERSQEITDKVKEFFAADKSKKYPKLFDQILNLGIIDSRNNIPAGREVQIIISTGRKYNKIPEDTASCSARIADDLELKDPERQKFIDDFQKQLGHGNLIFDQAATAADADAAANAVKPVVKSRKRGDLILEKKQLITAEHIDMLNAEKLSLPAGYGMALLGGQLLICFILLLAALFFLYRTYPGIFRAPRHFNIAGFSVILSLLINFAALQIFLFLFSRGILPEHELILFLMPIPLGAALISALLGNRTAVFSGFVIASITAMMVMPDRAFELVIRWFAIASLLALVIRNVSNYRSFFVRIFFGGVLLTALVNCDIIYSFKDDPVLLKNLTITLLANSLFCGVAALLAIFIFELVFNVDTSMSLMVLGDFNHPLLEQLKRNAPGTMFHSMTVATLAEDAAREIRANAARAKVGALFHDIGKLKHPEYFVENNVDSPQNYENMSPSECCSRICSHVADGLEMAREHRLNSFIREAIATHHGDDLISFFYQRALEQNQEHPQTIKEADFRYKGKPPVGKELTIIALADACEAASRSLNKPTDEMVEKLVNDIFTHRIRGGQLRNSTITLEELELVRQRFIADLISLNHSRIAYKRKPEK